MAEQMETEDVLLVCLGPCKLEGGKPGLRFVAVSEDEYNQEAFPEHAKELVYPPKAFKPPPYPGLVKRFQFVKGSTRIIASTGRYFGLWKDEVRRRVWEAERKTLEVAEQQESMEKKGKEDSALEDLIAPLRETYRKLPYPRKAAFIAHLLASLTR